MSGGLFGNTANGSHIDVEAFMDSDISGRLARVVDLGCLISIGSTRDGGAISITITHDGNWDREYFRDAASGIEWLDYALSKLQGELGLVPRHAQPSPQKPVRRRQKLT